VANQSDAARYNQAKLLVPWVPPPDGLLVKGKRVLTPFLPLFFSPDFDFKEPAPPKLRKRVLL
jgi:hypothetical protein